MIRSGADRTTSGRAVGDTADTLEDGLVPGDDYVATQEELHAVASIERALRVGKGVILIGRSQAGCSPLIATALRNLGSDVVVRMDRRDAAADGVAGGLPVFVSTARRLVSPDLIQAERVGRLAEVALPPLAPFQVLEAIRSRFGGDLGDPRLTRLIPMHRVADLDLLLEAIGQLRDRGSSPDLWVDAAPAAGALAGTGLRERALAVVEGIGGDFDAITWTLDLLSLVPELEVRRTEHTLSDLGVSDPTGVLERLETAEVITAEMNGDDVHLHIRDGAVQQVLRWALGSLRRRRLAGSVEPRLRLSRVANLSRGELLHLATSESSGGFPGKPEILTAAARASLRMPDRTRSLRIAQAAVDSGGGFDAEMLLAAAKIEGGETEEAEHLLQDLMPRAKDDAERMGVIVALMRLTFDTPTDVAGLGGYPERQLDDLQRELLQGFLLHALGDVVGGARLVERGMDRLAGAGLAHAHYIVGMARVLEGRFEEATDHLDRAESMLGATQEDASMVQMLRANMLFYQGRARESISMLRDFMASDRSFHDPGALGTFGHMLGWLLLMTGSTSSAIREYRRSVDHLEIAGITTLALMARSELASALAVAGRPDDGAAVILPNEIELAKTPGGPPLTSSTLAQARGWLAASAGDRAEAARLFTAAAAICEKSDMATGVFITLFEAARCGDAREVIARVRALATRIEGPFVAFASRFVEELARERSSGSGAEWEAIARDALAMGLHPLAAEAFAHSVEVYTGEGLDREAAAAARRRDEQMRICGIDRILLMPQRPVRALSIREGEIADLAAEGLSNREISERLVLSIRTVETHLLRVYQKLGIRRRGELADALRGAPRALAEDA